ncbi:hypothetical protein HAX54_049463 [Datura stramonium]|uniref:Uncharacterized protein n=1 Tax=Datura stramonium TaxID=4076 RepID=A0ABS8SV01_DATST|nr:hypothetical protein [Datura stramonium]
MNAALGIGPPVLTKDYDDHVKLNETASPCYCARDVIDICRFKDEENQIKKKRKADVMIGKSKELIDTTSEAQPSPSTSAPIPRLLVGKTSILHLPTQLQLLSSFVDVLDTKVTY